jgi:hypothetical protein
MEEMKTEIAALGWAREVSFFGVNQLGEEDGNPTIHDHTELPWLQDDPEQRAWEKWQVEFGDVVILDERNVIVAKFNVSAYSLVVQENYDDLKSLLSRYAGGGE